MPFTAQVVKVMIASPGDVPDERQAIRDIVSEWNYIHAEDRTTVLLPTGWETHSTPLLGDRPQALINKQVLANCDLLVAVFWTRLGSPTGKASSGTVEEIEEHLKSGKPAMLYFSNAPVRPDSVNEEQYKALREFKRQCYSRGLVESYDSLGEFRDKFARQLAQTMIRDFGSLEPAASPEVNNEAPLVRDLLTDDAKLILTTAAEGDGHVLHSRTLGGTNIQASRTEFINQQTPREVARWRAALEQLVEHGLISDRGYRGEVFEVTHRGHQVADEIKLQQPPVKPEST